MDIPETLVKEIELHIATFPVRYKETLEMKESWEKFREDDAKIKRQVFWLLIGFITSMLGIGIWVGTIQTNIESVIDHEVEDKQRFAALESEVSTLKVNNGQILTELANIKLGIQEIKTAIIRMQ